MPSDHWYSLDAEIHCDTKYASSFAVDSTVSLTVQVKLQFSSLTLTGKVCLLQSATHIVVLDYL